MKNPIIAQSRAQRLADALLLLHWLDKRDELYAYHEAQAEKAWKELKEVME